LGASVAFFVFYFRHLPGINFGVLKYVLAGGAVWFVVSEVAKRKGIFNPKSHFLADSLFYLTFFNALIFLTGGFKGGLMPILVAAMISAPFFSGNLGTVIFSLALIGSSVAVYFLDPSQADPYSTGLVVLYSISSLIVVLMVKSFINREKVLEEEQIHLVTREVDFKTKELQETLDELNKNRAALKDKIGRLEQFQKLVVGRELKMIELKSRIRELEGKKEPTKK
jgi:hypothetical protein